ncbi:MAG TPA: potassium channel family protein [Pyrinomonadaceae bacterium]
MARVLLLAFAIMGLCLVIHVTGIVILGEEVVRRRAKIEERSGFTYAAGMLMVVFAIIVLLHLIEATVWAVFYYWSGLFSSFESALYFSLTSYSTLGYGDVLLPPSWRLLGTIEGISGVLLCGLSTAFLFAVVNALFSFGGLRVRRERIHKTVK